MQRFVLLTDFGPASPYIGQIRMLLNDLRPETQVIELISDMPVFRPDLSAYFLPSLLQGLPTGNICLCVVDPGVGSDREGLVLRAGGNWFVGPDNGLMSRLAAENTDAQLWRIDWRPDRMSRSFHGRDLFMPIGVRISGQDFSGLTAISLDSMVGNDWPDRQPKVIFIDHYGNLCTGIKAAGLAGQVRVSGRKLQQAGTFSDVPPGEAFWYENSFGLLEIAVNRGRADQVLGVGLGDGVILEG